MEAPSGLWRRSPKKRHHARAPEHAPGSWPTPSETWPHSVRKPPKARPVPCPCAVHPVSIPFPSCSLSCPSWPSTAGKKVGNRRHPEACALSFRCPSCVHPLSIPCPSCSFSVHPALLGVEKRGKSCPSCATEWPLYNIKRGEGSTAPAWRPPRRPHGSPTCGPSRILPPGQIEREFRPRL